MGHFTIIAAIGENHTLGKDNELVWHLPDDFKRFRQLTTGYKIIMGRKTFESFPKPLPNREHLIITRNKSYEVDHPQCTVVHSLEEALELAGQDPKAFVIGGGEIYKLAMPFANSMEITHVHGTFEGDAFFPEIDMEEWELISESEHPADARHSHSFTYKTYVRNGQKSK